jgi:cephalosporin hydroxylase
VNWLYSLLGKLGHVNGNIVHRDLAETKSTVSALKSEISAMRMSLAGLAIQPVQDACERFHVLYYNTPERTWENTYWLGTKVQKYPMDMWIYQEILYELKPDVIIESGTYLGGSALFLASICDLLDHGRVISIDVQEQLGRPEHPRILYLLGSSVEPSIIERVKAEIHNDDKVLVVLDSDHHQPHVMAELLAYGSLVSVGSYLIVEDTNINGHPVYPDFGPGPMEAVQEFLKSHPEFAVDSVREKFYITANPMGYLKRVSVEDTVTSSSKDLHECVVS